MGRRRGESVTDNGEPTAPFSYHDKGIMATSVHGQPVVQLAHGLRFRGTLAWLTGRVCTGDALGNRNRISALINLCWRYVA